MNNRTSPKLLFVINNASGNNKINYEEAIRKYLERHQGEVSYFTMPLECSPAVIRENINKHKPDRVIATGGDGTIKLVAEAVLETGIPLGIIPAGSANGMAKELSIPQDVNSALNVIIAGHTMPVSLIKVNDEYCIHLSDIGFNAFVVQKFESGKGRGMWGYVKASWQVLRSHDKMQVKITVDNKIVEREASMIVIANATRYGSGALINPVGQLDDDLFEVIIIRKISLNEIFKMMVTHSNYNAEKTEVFQTNNLHIVSKHKAHFQVDGEYLGKTNEVKATLLPKAISVIVPQPA